MCLTLNDINGMLCFTHLIREEGCSNRSIVVFVSQDRKPGEPFVPKPAKEAEMERIMRSMQVSILLFFINFHGMHHILTSNFCLNVFQGMPGAPGMQMYSREELMNMKNFGGEDADDDEDDDDEADFTKNLVLKYFV